MLNKLIEKHKEMISYIMFVLRSCGVAGSRCNPTHVVLPSCHVDVTIVPPRCPPAKVCVSSINIHLMVP